MTTVPPWKNIVLELLELLASEAQQMEYETKVPHVDVTRELVDSWFSDSYHPNDAIFTGCFSEGEFAVLSEFNRQFEQALTILPPSKGTVGNWLQSQTRNRPMQATQKPVRQKSVCDGIRVQHSPPTGRKHLNAVERIVSDQLHCDEQSGQH